MKIYEGERGMDGVKVTVNGTPLVSRNDIRSFRRTGLEWGFVGPGPQQLALALLADHLGDDERALALLSILYGTSDIAIGQCLAADRGRHFGGA